MNSYVYALDPVNQRDLDGKIIPFLAVAAIVIRVIPIVVALVKVVPKVATKVVQAVKTVYNAVKSVAAPAAKTATRTTTTATKPSAAPTPVQVQQLSQQASQTVSYLKNNSFTSSPSGYYQSSRAFQNWEGRLPNTTSLGSKITYKEFDTRPWSAGVNRGPERIVAGNDGSIWYTTDHYATFTRIQAGENNLLLMP